MVKVSMRIDGKSMEEMEVILWKRNGGRSVETNLRRNNRGREAEGGGGLGDERRVNCG
jgi:hypothetical protein